MSIFTKISAKKPKLNKFDLSHERKLSFNMGELIPIMLQDIVPGDKFRTNSEIFMRLAPMLAPIMHRVNVFTHYFFVPNRLIWDEWEDFITGGRLGTSMPVMPHMITNGSFAVQAKGSLWDYFGLPPYEAGAFTDSVQINTLPFRAYLKIFNEYYRDQNVSAEIPLNLTSGIETGSQWIQISAMRRRAWEKDYFTSALPWAQRGGDVSIPIEGEVDIEYDPQSRIIETDTGDPAGVDGLLGVSTGVLPGGLWAEKTNNTNQGVKARVENILEANLTGVNATINDLRRAIRLQEWLEKNARGGSRYIEQILSHFGVTSSDARLQRPEYLGGGKQPVSISEVMSTVETTEIPQANPAGRGVSAGVSNGFTRSFEEHGYVIGIMSVLPRTSYQQGIPRRFSYFDKFDYYWPEFANIGEQEIKTQELYFNPNGASGLNEDTFGYTPRYAEYKYACDTVHGDFRDELSYWHMGRIFSARPNLNANFVTSDPTHRIFAVEDPLEDKLYCQVYNKISALRPMPYFGTPQL